jgi:hypothetical protein
LTGDSPDRVELEAPPSADALYLYRADEVVAERPVQTGDVFDGVEIPGLDDGPGLAIVINHPCSMRSDGVDLLERLQLARVVLHQEVPLNAWKRHHQRVMPLPDLLLDGSHYAVRFSEFGLVRSATLDLARRVACLDPYGVNLLQQRFIWDLARFFAPTAELHKSCAVAFQEISFMEEWNAGWADAGLPEVDAARAFHEWIRDDGGTGMSRQDRLADEQQRAPLRRDMRRHLREFAKP